MARLPIFPPPAARLLCGGPAAARSSLTGEIGYQPCPAGRLLPRPPAPPAAPSLLPQASPSPSPGQRAWGAAPACSGAPVGHAPPLAAAAARPLRGRLRPAPRSPPPPLSRPPAAPSSRAALEPRPGERRAPTSDKRGRGGWGGASSAGLGAAAGLGTGASGRATRPRWGWPWDGSCRPRRRPVQWVPPLSEPFRTGPASNPGGGADAPPPPGSSSPLGTGCSRNPTESRARARVGSAPQSGSGGG